jgi:hypothetical protein
LRVNTEVSFHSLIVEIWGQQPQLDELIKVACMVALTEKCQHIAILKAIEDSDLGMTRPIIATTVDIVSRVSSLEGNAGPRAPRYFQDLALSVVMLD